MSHGLGFLYFLEIFLLHSTTLSILNLYTPNSIIRYITFIIHTYIICLYTVKKYISTKIKISNNLEE